MTEEVVPTVALTPRERAIEALTPTERGSFERYMASGQPALGAQKAAEFFALYLNGSSCSEIQRLNPDFKFGSIIRARIDFLWDEMRAEHIVKLLSGVRERVQQIQLESVEFLANMMAASHKKNGDKLKKYLQTGKEEDLGDLKVAIGDLKNYAKVVALLMSVTGQDRQQKVSGEVTVKHEQGDATVNGLFDVAKPLSGLQASKLLALEVKRKDESP